jgi:hypothetical protein
MNREQAIELIKLLSALESWGFAAGHTIPDYLHERLSNALDKLTEDALK